MEVRAYRDNQLWGAGLNYGSTCFAQNPDYIATLAKHHGGEGLILEALGDEAYFIPIMLTRRAFLRVATFLDVPRDRQGNTAAAAAEIVVVNAAIEYLKKSGLADRIAQSTNWCRFQSAPPHSLSTGFGSYVLNLQQPAETIWSGLHQKHRNSIRAAEKAGVKVRSGADQVLAFHKLYAATMSRSQMHGEQLAFYEELAAKPGLSVYCSVAYDGDTPLAALFVPYTQCGAFYLCGATADSMSIGGANSYLHYQAITHLRERGAKSYDFVGARLTDVSGTKLEHIQRFKARFGGDLQTGVIWKMDLNKVRCASFNVLSSAKQAISGAKSAGDVIDQERQKLELSA